MAGGASSRMKKSLGSVPLSDSVREAAKNLHKSLIPLDDKARPLLYFLLRNAVEAGIRSIYLITSSGNKAFQDFVQGIKGQEPLRHLEVKFAIQEIPMNRQKPLGTADALEQCLEQYPGLLEQRFTVCNGDNLYSSDVFKQLNTMREIPNALIAYDGSALGHSKEKIAKFALLDFDEKNLLNSILEKPSAIELEKYTRKHNKLWVSMNIFNFDGATIFPYLKKCPVHPIRQEKELPKAVEQMVDERPGSVLCIQKSEEIPDLTSAKDISSFFQK